MFPDVACGEFDDVMFSEEEDSQVLSGGLASQSQLTAAAANGLLNLNRLIIISNKYINACMVN